mgnify:CR=1 FL=1
MSSQSDPVEYGAKIRFFVQAQPGTNLALEYGFCYYFVYL